MSAPISQESGVQIQPLDAANLAAWDDFVTRHPDGTFFHLSGWKRVLERSFGHVCHFLTARRGPEIIGVLPLCVTKSFLFGRALTSLPFCVQGGPLTTDEAAFHALNTAAIDLAEGENLGVIEYRARFPLALGPGWLQPAPKSAIFKKHLEGEEAADLKAIPRKQRAVVRKALDSELVCEQSDDPDRFFPLYAESVRNLGTPVFSPNLFRNLKAEFGEACEILVVTHQGQDVCGLMSFYFRNQVLPYYAGGGRAARGLGGHDLMYFDLMRRAPDRDVEIFDFGRSRLGSGPAAFKKNWGFEPTPLPYAWYLPGGGELPDKDPSSGKYARMVSLWQRLPLPVANRLGPLVSKYLG